MKAATIPTTTEPAQIAIFSGNKFVQRGKKLAMMRCGAGIWSLVKNFTRKILELKGKKRPVSFESIFCQKIAHAQQMAAFTVRVADKSNREDGSFYEWL